MYDESQLYTTYTTQATDAGVLAVLGGMLLFMLIVAVATYVLTALGLMKFFEKAGKPAWAAWVPFYNVWLMTEVGAAEQYWFWIFVGGIVLSAIPFLGQLLSLAVIVALVYITYRFLGKFGKDAGHTALAVLFPFVYYPVVGYSKDLKFSGKAPVAAKAKTS